MASQDDPSFSGWGDKCRMKFDEGYSEEEMNAAIDKLDEENMSDGMVPMTSHDAALASSMATSGNVVHDDDFSEGAASANADGSIPPATLQGVAGTSVANSQTATETPQPFQNPTGAVTSRDGAGVLVTPFGNCITRSNPVESSSIPSKAFVVFSSAYDFASNKAPEPSMASTSVFPAATMGGMQIPSRTFERLSSVRTPMNKPRGSPGHRRIAALHTQASAGGGPRRRPIPQQGTPASFANPPISLPGTMTMSSYHSMDSSDSSLPSSRIETQQQASTSLNGDYAYNASAASMAPPSYTSGLDNSGMGMTADYTEKPHSNFYPQWPNGSGPRPHDVSAITPHTHATYRGLLSPGAPPSAPVRLHRTARSDLSNPFSASWMQPYGLNDGAQDTAQHAPQDGRFDIAPAALAGPAMLPQSANKVVQSTTPVGSPAPSNARTPRSNPNMPGQKPGYPQDRKQHLRRCNPFSKICDASCGYEANHPEKWELHGKKLYRLQAPASWQETLPDGSSVTRVANTGHIVSGLWLTFWCLEANQTTKVTRAEQQRHNLDWQTYAH
ncbi:hypothetical protein LTR95_010235 [Oleoguttula sp. CCFEE 5521]